MNTFAVTFSYRQARRPDAHDDLDNVTNYERREMIMRVRRVIHDIGGTCEEENHMPDRFNAAMTGTDVSAVGRMYAKFSAPHDYGRVRLMLNEQCGLWNLGIVQTDEVLTPEQIAERERLARERLEALARLEREREEAAARERAAQEERNRQRQAERDAALAQALEHYAGNEAGRDELRRELLRRDRATRPNLNNALRSTRRR